MLTDCLCCVYRATTADFKTVTAAKLGEIETLNDDDIRKQVRGLNAQL